LTADLRDLLGLRRAVETGTFQGGGTRALAAMFPSVVTVELSEHYFELARSNLAALPNVVTEHASSPTLLRSLAPEPTLYWLDAHWSGLETAGADNPCPVLEEIAAIPAHPADCLLIDDARLFAATTEPDRWPTLVCVLDALRKARPVAHVTVLHDLIVCVPPAAKKLVDEFGMRHAEQVWAAGEDARLWGSEYATSDSDEPGSSTSYLTPALRRLRALARATRSSPG
jgi:hypothetical protein